MARITYKKGINVSRVVAKIAYTIISLYVGGTILIEIGNVMNCTSSPFYQGLTLIGWTVSNSVVPNTSGTCNATGQLPGATATYNSLITATSGTGILSVIGIIAIASIVLEFVNFKM